MKIKLSICIFALLGTSIIGCQTQDTSEETSPDTQGTTEHSIEETAPETVFDSLLAQRLGADQYGMKKYVMAFLYRGANRANIGEEEATQLQAAHMENIGKMAEAGKLALAGPFFGDGDLRGIYIFDVNSLAEAEELTNSDPAIQAGSLRMELFEWYGSAGLMEVNNIHSRIAKINI